MKLCNLNNMNTYNTYMNKHFITLTSVSVQAGYQYFVAHLVPASKKQKKVLFSSLLLETDVKFQP